jgi:hypothetical protein
MIRLIAIVALVYICYRALKSWIFKAASPIEQGDRRTPAGHIDDVMVKDPYCEVYFPKRKGVPLKKDGELLLFCSEQCREKYRAKQDA